MPGDSWLESVPVNDDNSGNWTDVLDPLVKNMMMGGCRMPCDALTKAGTRCKSHPKLGTGYTQCWIHLPEETRRYETEFAAELAWGRKQVRQHT